MNAILKAVAMAEQGAMNAKLRDAEVRYHLARQVFGIDNLETKTAWNYWHALRRDVRESKRAKAAGSA